MAQKHKPRTNRAVEGGGNPNHEGSNLTYLKLPAHIYLFRGYEGQATEGPYKVGSTDVDWHSTEKKATWHEYEIGLKHDLISYGKEFAVEIKIGQQKDKSNYPISLKVGSRNVCDYSLDQITWEACDSSGTREEVEIQNNGIFFIQYGIYRFGFNVVSEDACTINLGIENGTGLTIKGFTVFSHDRKTALLQDTDFLIHRGDMAFFLGPSGCGKSTFLKGILGTLPSTGKLNIVDPFNRSSDFRINYRNIRDRISLAPQAHELAFDDTLTLRHILFSAYYLRRRSEKISPPKKGRRFLQRLFWLPSIIGNVITKMPTDKKFREVHNIEFWQGIRIKDLLLEFGIVKKHEQPIAQEQLIDEILEKPMKDFSGGEKQRLGLIIEIINAPMILMVDELTSPLDINSAAIAIKALQKLWQKMGFTLLYVTHRPLEDIPNFLDKATDVKRVNIFLMSPIEKSIRSRFVWPAGMSQDDMRHVYETLSTAGANETTPIQIPRDTTGKNPYFPPQLLSRLDYLREAWLQVKREGTLAFRSLKNLFIVYVAPSFAGGLIISLLSPVPDHTELFILSLLPFWLVTNLAGQTIVKDKKIIAREVISGAHITPYLFGKLFIITLILVAMLAAEAFGVFVGSLRHAKSLLDYGLMVNFHFFLIIGLLGLVGMGLGLLISASSHDEKRPLIIIPFIMVIFILFSGLIVKFNGVALAGLQSATPLRWTMEAHSHAAKTFFVEVTKEDGQPGEKQIERKPGMELVDYYFTYDLRHAIFRLALMFALFTVVTFLLLKHYEQSLFLAEKG